MLPRFYLPRVKIAIASDHAGYQYKQALVKMLTDLGHEVLDFGTDSQDTCDYPLFIRPAAQALARGEADRAIVLGGSGNGEAITANRVPGVRCALCWSEQTALWARQHNDANCLSLGQRTIPLDLAKKIVQLFLETPFDAGRHLPRIKQIDT